MRLFNKKIEIDNEEFWLTVDKYFDWHGKIDYYTYKCNLYKKSLFGIKKCVYSYKTYWLDYLKYHGDIDMVIDETINNYKGNLREQKYISKNENNFKSKYEI